ncbi:ribosome biogenesis protein [Candidatus Woesearchaeota archaeon]|nr:MAG: ribosome biogenesis protein [Candidatus Woesearchaeota archaeon]
MSNHIYYCNKCKEFSMEKICPKCKSVTLSVKPAKYSPEDKWGKYRRMAKEQS